MSTYRIRSGDTLSGIARRHNTTVDDLARANNIEDPNKIRAGERLHIPDGFDAPSTQGTRRRPRGRPVDTFTPATRPQARASAAPTSATRPQARPSGAPTSATRPQARPSAAPTSAPRPQARPSAAPTSAPRPPTRPVTAAPAAPTPMTTAPAAPTAPASGTRPVAPAASTAQAPVTTAPAAPTAPAPETQPVTAAAPAAPTAPAPEAQPVTAEDPAAPTAPAPWNPPTGFLSREGEADGPGTVSPGTGDAGGISYGSYQFSTNRGSAREFVDSLATSHPEYHAALSPHTPGTPEFGQAWRDLAAQDPEGFFDAQHDYVQGKYYDGAAALIQQNTGMDLSTRSTTLSEVVWSTSVQHGETEAANYMSSALAGRDPATVTDEELIQSIYAERGRRNENGTLVHFRSSLPHIQEGVAARFVREEARALEMLREEQGGGAPTSALIPPSRPEGLTSPSSALIPPSRPEGLAAQSSAPVTAPPGTTAQAPAPWYSQFDHNRVERAGNDACFRAVTAMARDAGVTVQDSSHIIQVGTSEDGEGRLAVDSAQAQAGREYIDGQLDAGRPVAVGVSHKDAAYNVDALTDHFVLITGRGVDEQGRTFYTFHDPATQSAETGMDTNPNNRFYVDDSTGMMYREGPHTGFVVDRGYDVSMVRINAE